MNIEHLYDFLVIAESKSINKASRRLYISQQHLSRIVRALENDVHAKLLQRSSSGIELTEKGEAFRRFAEKIVTDYRELQSYFFLDGLPEVANDQPVQGTCRISFPFFFSVFLTDFIQKLAARYPAITIKCFENAHSYSPDELYRSDMLHMLLDTYGRFPAEVEDTLSCYHIGDTTVSVCVNASSPLARKRVLTPDDIAKELQTTYLMEEGCFKNNANILFASSNIYQHLDSVIHNNSICTIPTYIRSGIYAAYPNIVLIPYEKQQSIPIYIVHSSQHPLQIADRAVIRFVAQYIRSMSEQDRSISR